MRKTIYWILALTLALPGCSIYKAATAPDPIVLDNIKVGANRTAIVGTLGVPKTSETKQDVKTDVFEFVNGSHSGTKARIIAYIAGDIFTAGIAEILFWPIELAAGQGTQGRAVVTYGMDDIARSVLLLKSDGSPWESESGTVTESPVAMKATNKVNPETGAIIQD